MEGKGWRENKTSKFCSCLIQPQYNSVSGFNTYKALVCPISLKMLGLYLHTLIISRKSGYMLSILNKLTLQKELQTFVANNVF